MHRDSGQSRGEAIRSALREIRVPLVGSTVTPIVVFLPLISITGVTGTFFRALAVTVGTALLTSLALALTWTPTLSHYLLRRRRSGASDRGRRSRRTRRADRVHGSRDARLRARAAVRAGLSAGVRNRVRRSDRRLLLLRIRRSAATCCLKWTKADSFSTTSCRPDRPWPTPTRCCWASKRFSRRRRKSRAPRGAPGLQLGLAAVTEANTGDFSVRLKRDRDRGIDEIISDVRAKVNKQYPQLDVEFLQVLARHDRRPHQLARADRDQAVFRGSQAAGRMGAQSRRQDQEDQGSGGREGRHREHHQRIRHRDECRSRRRRARGLHSAGDRTRRQRDPAR